MMELGNTAGFFYGVMGYDGVSQVAIRPAFQLPEIQEMLRKKFAVGEIISIRLVNNDDWPLLAEALEKSFRFPSTVAHSFQALYEYMVDLDWIEGGHHAVLLDVSDLDRTADHIFSAIDIMLKAVSEVNVQQKLKLTVVVFI